MSYEHHTTCWICGEVELGYEWDRWTKNWVGEGKNTVMGHHVRVCSNCWQQIKRKYVKPKSGRSDRFPSKGDSWLLGDLLCEWIPLAAAYYRALAGDKGKPKPPEPFVFRFVGGRSSGFNLLGGTNGSIVLGVLEPSSFVGTAEARERFIDAVHNLLRFALPEHRKRWKIELQHLFHLDYANRIVEAELIERLDADWKKDRFKYADHDGNTPDEPLPGWTWRCWGVSHKWGSWNVIHLPSGPRTAGHLNTKHAAKVVAMTMDGWTDWHRPSDELDATANENGFNRRMTDLKNKLEREWPNVEIPSCG